MKKILTVLPMFFMLAPVVLADDIVVSPPKGGYTDLGSLISNIISLALIVAGLLVFLYLVWGGIQWLTSGGDKAGVEAARNRITAALIGLVIVAAAFAVIKLIETFFNLCIVSCPIKIPGPK